MPIGIYDRTEKQIKQAIKNVIPFQFKKGHKVLKEWRKKISKANKRNRYTLGRKHTEEAKKKIGEKSKGRKPTKETRRKMSIAAGGTGIPQKRKRYKHITDWRYKKWRKAVFERDDYTCQVCRKVGIYLVAHHIKGWAKYPKLRYKIDNGVTLCRDCHKLTGNFRGRAK